MTWRIFCSAQRMSTIRRRRRPAMSIRKQYAAFGMDEWKVTPRLTFTVGLRYEYTSPEKDTRGYSFTIVPGLQSQRYRECAHWAWSSREIPGRRTGWYYPDYTNIAPRFGFAWDPYGNGRTSLRGGFGMFYDTLNGWMSDWATDEPPFAGSADLFFNPSGNGPNTTLAEPYETAGAPDPFPSQIPPPSDLDFNAEGLIPFGNGNNNFVDPHLKTPYIYQYNLDIQQQLVQRSDDGARLCGKLLAQVADMVGRESLHPGNYHPHPQSIAARGLSKFRLHHHVCRAERCEL